MRKEPKKEPLKARYEGICNEYLAEFCIRHEFDLADAWWVADEPGTVAFIADYFFSFGDIRYDVDNSVPGDAILEWYDYDLEVRTLETDYLCSKNLRSFVKISYPSWCKGAPKPYSDEELAKMRPEIDKMAKSGEKMRTFIKNYIKSVR